MEIVHVIDALTMGGAEKMEVLFAQAIRTAGSRLTVVSLDRDDDTPIPDELERLGARVARFPSRRLLDPLRLARLVLLLRSARFDVLQTQLTYANILGPFAGRLAGIPVIGTLHSAAYDTAQRNPVKRLLETWALVYGCRAVIAVGHAVAAAHHERLHRARVVVIPNGVAPGIEISPEERMRLRTALMGSPEHSLLIAVGRLAPPKGYFDLLKAFAAVRETRRAVRLVIAGEGPLRADLVAETEKLNIGDSVRLLGERANVPELLRASDLFVSASHWEGLPLSVLEAMSASLPVIATSVGDVPQVVVAETGMVVPPHDPAALANAIRLLLDNPARRATLGKNAQLHVARHYSIKPWFERYQALYDEASTERAYEVRQTG